MEAVKGFVPSEEGGTSPPNSDIQDSVSYSLPNSSLRLLMIFVLCNLYS